MMKIKDFLSNGNWIKGHLARDRWGKPCGALDPEATGWDILGAINVCYSPEERQAVMDNLLPGQLLCMWNDSATWEQVHELLQKANV